MAFPRGEDMTEYDLYHCESHQPSPQIRAIEAIRGVHNAQWRGKALDYTRMTSIGSKRPRDVIRKWVTRHQSQKWLRALYEDNGGRWLYPRSFGHPTDDPRWDALATLSRALFGVSIGERGEGSSYRPVARNEFLRHYRDVMGKGGGLSFGSSRNNYGNTGNLMVEFPYELVPCLTAEGAFGFAPNYGGRTGSNYIMSAGVQRVDYGGSIEVGEDADGFPLSIPVPVSYGAIEEKHIVSAFRIVPHQGGLDATGVAFHQRSRDVAVSQWEAMRLACRRSLVMDKAERGEELTDTEFDMMGEFYSLGASDGFENSSGEKIAGKDEEYQWEDSLIRWVRIYQISGGQGPGRVNYMGDS